MSDVNPYPSIYLIDKHFVFHFTYEHNLSIRLIELQYLYMVFVVQTNLLFTLVQNSTKLIYQTFLKNHTKFEQICINVIPNKSSEIITKQHNVTGLINEP